MFCGSKKYQRDGGYKTVVEYRLFNEYRLLGMLYVNIFLLKIPSSVSNQGNYELKKIFKVQTEHGSI